MASVKTFLTLEFSLQRRLRKDWQTEVVRPLIAEIEKRVADNDFRGARDLAITASFEDTLERQRGFVDVTARSAYLLGQNLWTGRVSKTLLGSGQEDLPLQVEIAAGVLSEGFEKGALRVREDLQNALDVAEDAVLKAEVPGLGAALNKAVATGGSVIDIGANLTTGRLAAYGALVQAGAEGAQRYQVSEVLDKRTCPVCRRMHGRVFDHPQAVSRLETQLMTMDTSAAFPFTDASKEGIRKMTSLSAQELSELGWTTPPFHPACRGIIVRTGTVPDRQRIPFSPLPAGLTLAEAAAEELKDAAKR